MQSYYFLTNVQLPPWAALTSLHERLVELCSSVSGLPEAQKTFLHHPGLLTFWPPAASSHTAVPDGFPASKDLPEENGDGKTQACEPEPKPAELKICLKNGLHLALTELLSFSLDLTSVSESCVCFKRQVLFCIGNTVQKLSAHCNKRIKI